MKERSNSSDPAVRERKRLYASMTWRRLRQQVLKHSPTCVLCGRPAQAVDHIEHTPSNSRFFDLTNLRSVCTPCNTHAGNREREWKRAAGVGRVVTPGGKVTTNQRLSRDPPLHTEREISRQKPRAPTHDALFDRLRNPEIRS